MDTATSTKAGKMPRVLSALRRRRPYLWASAAAALFLANRGGVLVTGQPSATKLLTIPCTLVVPGNQQRTAPVYGLTECYHATVCIDQPVASDVITPPPAVLPPAPSPAPGGGRPQDKDPAATEAEGVKVNEEYITEDKEDIAEATDQEPIPVNEMPGLEPGMGSAWSAGFGTKHMRRLRGGSEEEERRLNEADVGNLYGYQEEGYDDEVGSSGGDKAGNQEAAASSEWDFRQQRFGGVEEGAPAELSGSGGGGGGVEASGTAGYIGQGTQGVLHTKAAVAAVAAADGLTDAEGAVDQDPMPVAQGTGEDGGPGAGDSPTEPSQPSTPPPPKFVPPPKDAPAPPPVQQVVPPQDTYVGGVGEIAVVRVCSREVVCQECGPVNVVPRCTCSMVLYDPLTDPDYFLK